MAETRVASRRGAMGNVPARRYGGYSIEAATRPPRDTPPAPPPPPGAPGPRPRPPHEALAPPPAWVRAWHRLGYGFTPTAKEFDALAATMSPARRCRAAAGLGVDQRLRAGCTPGRRGYSTLAKDPAQTVGRSCRQWAGRTKCGCSPAWRCTRLAGRAVFSARQLHERRPRYGTTLNVMPATTTPGPCTCIQPRVSSQP